MKKLLEILSALILFVCFFGSAQIIINPSDLNDPFLINMVNNYFGCKKWNNSQCLQCSRNYYFNSKGVCCEVKPECRIFNQDMGICQKCYQGYQISDGKCILLNISETKQRGCNKWENGVCVQCSRRWYFGSDGVCYPVDQNCRNWRQDGTCQLCYNGYKIQQKKCIRQQNNRIAQDNIFCANWQQNVCLNCSFRSFFNQQGICEQIDPNCNTWDAQSGKCLTCYKGYNLSRGRCSVNSSYKQVIDLGCKTWDWDNQKCLQCSNRWVFGRGGVCFPVNDYCKQFDSLGSCVSCFDGYKIQDGFCQIQKQNGTSNPGCHFWDWRNQRCMKCSYRWYMAENGVCRQVQSSCESFSDSGICKSCYFGYRLNQGRCQIQNILCKSWINNVCSSCYAGYILYKSQCVSLSKLANIRSFYSECCPQKLQTLQQQNRIK